MWGSRGWRVLLLCILPSLLLSFVRPSRSLCAHCCLPGRLHVPSPFSQKKKVRSLHRRRQLHLESVPPEQLCFAAAVAATAALACSEAETEMEKRAAAKKPKRAKQGPGGSGSFQPKRNVRKGKARKR